MGNYIEDYLNWLLNRVNYSGHSVGDYIYLLTYLFEREFTWSIPMDENRAKDGVGLRYEYCEEYNVDEEVFGQKPCSVLEFMIALSVNWEHEITYDFRKGDRSNKWFWLMLDNLGLLDYPDYEFDGRNVEKIVDIFLNRSYQKNGEGGMFPLKTGKMDQTRCEIWMQLQNYLIENW